MQKFIYIFLTLLMFSSNTLLAETKNIPEENVFEKLSSTGTQAGELFLSAKDGQEGPITKTAKYIVMFLGVIIFSMGIHETFMAEDRGGEGKKTKGVMKMIGGGLFIAISQVITWVVT